MATATLVGQGLSRYCPTTNHYYCGDREDGVFLLVTIPRFDVGGSIEARTGLALPIKEAHLPTHADVFLSDADANVLDADGDPANGMTPLLRVPDCESFEQALAAAGHTLA
ncbi:hypothetical protein A5630_23020 [Mycolicibacterium mucogenicum]|uniref:DUF7572 domain-containing protein n=1 Tax=Mycolicibacterium mucogenicum TaxID=56689 RepID=A0A1A3H130_MYCMU|nr:hypothetical protein [Mycolicibacterium mucogenicum]OBJ41316.1 hypothetical protein A5630_23020 [Mycolicibacterium mucogenicum]